MAVFRLRTELRAGFCGFVSTAGATSVVVVGGISDVYGSFKIYLDDVWTSTNGGEFVSA
jgi:hypothetical protein